MNKNYDFIISGAGLVGAISALQLSRKGYDCCLIEKNYLPIQKTLKDFAPLSLNYRSFLILKKPRIRNCIILCIEGLAFSHFSGKE